MNRMLRPLVAVGFVAAATAVFSQGCADNNSSLFIVGVEYDKPPTCVVTADPTQEELGYGILDVAFRSDYQAWLLVGNQFTPRGSKQTLRTETTRINLRGAEVTLTNSDGSALKDGNTTVGQFSVYGSGYADSSTSEEPGWGLFAADLIPSSVGDILAKPFNGKPGGINTVVATVRVFGNTLGNTSVTSGELSFPIQVCYGCLVQYPLEALVFPTNGGTPTCSAGSTDIPVPGCRVGQDDTVDCRSCQQLSICQTLQTQ